MSAGKQTFEYLGFLEQVIDARHNSILGTRRCFEQPERVFGAAGEKQETVTSDLHLQRGHKEVIIKCSPTHALKIRTWYLPICGRMLPPDTVEVKDAHSL